MNRKIVASIVAVILLAMMLPFTTAHAANDAENITVFLADFDGESNQFYGAYQDASFMWHAIAWENASGEQAHEDDMGEAYNESNRLYYADFTFDTSHTYDHFMHLNNKDFAWRDLDDSDIGTIDNVKTHDGIIDGTLNGDYVQFNSSVHNGPIFLLREANPNTAQDARGWLTQDNKLVSFVRGNGESTPELLHKVYISTLLH